MSQCDRRWMTAKKENPAKVSSSKLTYLLKGTKEAKQIEDILCSQTW